jgi:hypothetical protein
MALTLRQLSPEVVMRIQIYTETGLTSIRKILKQM